MRSTTFRLLRDALAAHLPHLHVEVPHETETRDEVVARIEPGLTISHRQTSGAKPEGDRLIQDHHGYSGPKAGWVSYPINYGGEHYADLKRHSTTAPRDWSVAKDGKTLGTFGDLPDLIRFLRQGGY
jgi:hypothetical protein